MPRCADNKLIVLLQAVEEGIKATDVPAVLQKCTSDLLDLTDLVRGKLGTQVGRFRKQPDALCAFLPFAVTKMLPGMLSTRVAPLPACGCCCCWALLCRPPGWHAGTSSCSKSAAPAQLQPRLGPEAHTHQMLFLTSGLPANDVPACQQNLKFVVICWHAG